ncbi:uncharacterized protein [Dermacentor andersoni]|uniref:uncharacterized protein isoform X2 n=1 Tax=Dermacentor andersoni TaxID=34620 RepID=UPI0024174D2C|nr:uncharacterized protein LOC129385024 isoform X1 [Dermacentor andersoni]
MVLTVLPNLLKYLSKKLPKKTQKARNSYRSHRSIEEKWCSTREVGSKPAGGRNNRSDRRLGEVLCNCWELKAIGPGSAKEATLDHMLEFLDSWEDHSKGLGFLSKHISVGLCVTLRTTKDLLRYLTEKAGFNYFMASHLSQDCLERSFGIVRQAGGANDHFTPA